MDEKLSEQLWARYPELADDGKERRWSPVSVECGNGWYRVILEALGLLDDIRAALRCEIQLAQIKSKFGALRIYWGASAQEIDNRERLLFEEICIFYSRRTCEFCGAPAELRSSGGVFLSTCDKHRAGDSSLSSAELSEIYGQLSMYERQGLATGRMKYVLTDPWGLPDGHVRYRLLEFPERYGPLKEGSFYGGLAVRQDEVMSSHEAYEQFMALKKLKCLLNHYWPDALGDIDRVISGGG